MEGFLNEAPAVKQHIEILASGKSVSHFIAGKIEELDSQENQQPFYVADLDCVLRAHLRWTTNLPRVKPFYAVKCNNSPAVISMLRALGTGFDCASKGEIQLVLSLGVTADNIIYAHPTKPSYHIKYARSQGVDTMTFDNEEELLKLSCCYAQAKLVLRIAVDDSKSLLKLNVKFGAPLSSAAKLLERAAQLGLQVIGVSFHVGCMCTESDTFKRAIADSRRVFDIAESLGFKMSLLDIGGGFSGTDDSVNFEEFSATINQSLEELFPPDSGVWIIAEPGRYYVQSAFTLLVNVIAKRVIVHEKEEMSSKCPATDICFSNLGERCLSSGNKAENSPNRTMEYYINDGVYGALNCVVSDPPCLKIRPYLHRAVGSSEPKYQSVLWGPTCDCLDKVLENYWIPELHVGDWLLLDNTGAYTSSLCSDFNSFERAVIHPVVTAHTYNTFIHSHSQHNA